MLLGVCFSVFFVLFLVFLNFDLVISLNVLINKVLVVLIFLMGLVCFLSVGGVLNLLIIVKLFCVLFMISVFVFLCVCFIFVLFGVSLFVKGILKWVLVGVSVGVCFLDCW